MEWSGVNRREEEYIYGKSERFGRKESWWKGGGVRVLLEEKRMPGREYWMEDGKCWYADMLRVSFGRKRVCSEEERVIRRVWRLDDVCVYEWKSVIEDYKDWVIEWLSDWVIEWLSDWVILSWDSLRCPVSLMSCSLVALVLCCPCVVLSL